MGRTGMVTKEDTSGRDQEEMKTTYCNRRTRNN